MKRTQFSGRSTAYWAAMCVAGGGHIVPEVLVIELAELARQKLSDESHVGDHGGLSHFGIVT